MKKTLFLLSILVCSNFYAGRSKAERSNTQHPLIDRIDMDLVWVQDKLNKENLTPQSVALLEKLKKALRTIQQNVNLLSRYTKEHETLKKLHDKEYLPLIEKYLSEKIELNDAVDTIAALEEKITKRLNTVVGTHPLAAIRAANRGEMCGRVHS